VTTPEQSTAENFDDSISRDAIEALHSAASAAGVEFDALFVRDALRRAVLAHPGDWATTWSARLKDVAEDMQLHGVAAKQPFREVLGLPRAGAPVIVFLPMQGMQHRWLILADRRVRKVLVLTESESAKWRTPRSLLNESRLADREAPIDFLALQPAAPCEPATPDHGRLGHPAGHLTPLRRLLRLLRLDARDIRTVAVFAIGIGGLSLATPIAVEQLINTIAFGNLMQPVVILSMMLFIGLGFMVGMQLIQTYIVEILQRRIFVRCLADLAYRLPRIRLSAYDGRYGPELVNRFLDVAIFQKSTASLLMDGLLIVVQALVGMMVLAFYHPYLLGYDVVMLAIVLGIIFILGRDAIPTAIEESIAKYDSVAWLEELARQPVSIKMGGGPELAMFTADHLAKEYLSARSAHFRILMRQIVASLSLRVFASTALLGLGGWLVIHRQLTLGQLVAAELIVTNIVYSITRFGKHFESYYDLLAATEKLGHLFDLPLERLGGEPPPKTKGAASLNLSDVEFVYPSGRALFGGMNAEIAAGERVAVVGPSGSGKSTLFQILYGLRTQSRGLVLLDGADVRQFNPASLRSQIALVQQLDLIGGSILDNVRWGRSQVTLADVNASLAAVGVLDTLLRLPEGLETRLSPDGRPLSGGQARAVTIARAIVGKPRLLLIDGALDELESQLLDRVADAVFHRQAPWTLLIATSHDATLRRCGKSLHLDLNPAIDKPAANGGSDDNNA